MKKITKFLGSIGLLITVFLTGTYAGHHQVPYVINPLKIIKKKMIAFVEPTKILPYSNQSNSEISLLNAALTDPLNKNIEYIYPMVKNYEELAALVKKDMHTVPYKEYINGYKNISLKSPVIQENLVQIPFELNKHRGTAFAYKVYRENLPAKTAVLIIPGTGKNQSTDILHNVGYHGSISEECCKLSDVYILIKPNEDVRAIHNGFHKLSEHFINVHLLRHGYTYSSSYMFEALALIKHLKNIYSKTGVVGLSQGGQAALFTALESEPDFAVVASGFSPIQWELAMADSSQIHIPDLYESYSLDRVKEKLKNSKTYYLFTLGLSEGTLYEHDAKIGKSAEFLHKIGNKNIFYYAHPGGHSFDLALTSTFMEQFQ